MIAYGFARGHLETDLALADRLGAVCLEVLPDWRALPDPVALRKRVAEAGLTLHSAHGCWGGQSIEARRVDLGDPDPVTRLASVDDLKRCLDWLAEAGGRYLVVHPGGLSAPDHQPTRRDALAESLRTLADHAQRNSLVVCVENMPPGVHPGSRMADLADLVAELDRPELALAIDTGHAHLNASPAVETLAAGRLLRTTHVHDNNGRHDTHQPPGLGTVDWAAWVKALDAIGYTGPIMLECIRHLRENSDSLNGALLERLACLTAVGDGPRS